MSELLTTVLFKVVLDKVFASAVTVMFALPLKETPFIVLALANVPAAISS